MLDDVIGINSDPHQNVTAKALNEGKIKIVKRSQAAEHFAKGGKVGDGSRFKALEGKLAGRPGVYDPAGLAASIGRNKFGKKRYQEMAAAGR